MSAFPNVIDPNLSDTGLAHGTLVAGLAAAKTDSSQGSPFYDGYPGMGFQCKIDFSCLYVDYEMLNLSNRKGRRVLNGSWISSSLTPVLSLSYFLTKQQVYQEIYENGVFSCFAAGNSYHGVPYQYAYPASLDYVFSVSGVNHVNTTGTYNVKGMHESTIGDSMNRIGFHNTRVDLLAPYNDIGGLTYYPTNTNPTWQKYTPNYGWGTSFATPLVAGTAALILSVDKCYTPYQLEYILKKSADATVLSKPQNGQYAGRLGAGALDAGEALSMVANKNPNINPQRNFKTNCNDPATTTFFIEGVSFNTICAPGYSTNPFLLPILEPILRNGNPPYTYRWEYMPGNNVTLNSLTANLVSITASTGNRKAVLRLTVYDGSDVQKVASRYFTIQLDTTNTYNLSARDSWMDMFDEPNLMDTLDRRDNNFFMSPDLWNRQVNDSLFEHENAEYYSVASMYNCANVRIRNIGCSTYNANTTPHYVKLYWTVASTGENWKNDWDGSTTLPGAVSGQYMPGGGEITVGNGRLIGTLSPASSTAIRQDWRPVNPQDYSGAPTDLNVCLLARIVNASDGGMKHAEVGGPVITNVRNNNNIVTRNLWVGNIYPNNITRRTRVLIANADDADRTFDVQFINDKAIHLHFAGNFSAIGYVKLHLGALYDVWLGAGGEGSYLERNDEEQWVMMDGSQTLELLNLPLEANAKYPVDVEFSLYDGVAIPEYRFDFHLRQFAHDADGIRIPDVYGSMSFQINTSSEGEDDGPEVGNKAFPQTTEETTNNSFSIYPNPVKNNLTVSYLGDEEKQVTINIFDMMGRKLQTQTDQYFHNSYIEMDVSDFVPGVYFISITNDKGVSERFKFVKE